MEKKVDSLEKNVGSLEVNVASLNIRMDRVEESIKRMDITLENKFWKAVETIGEGHDFLKMGVEEARTMQLKSEWMEVHILKLESDMLLVKEKVGIA